MTVELDLDDIDYSSYMNWALEKGLWNGREVTWKQAPKYYSELEQAIQQLLLSQYQEGYEFKQMAAELARIGGSPEDRNLLEKDIQELRLLPNGTIVEVGFGKSLSKFWKKHKKEILIGAAVVAVVTTIVVVTVCTAGAGAGAAAAVASAGGAASSKKDKDEEGNSSKVTKNTDENLARSNEVVINNPPTVETDNSKPSVTAWDEILQALEIDGITPSQIGAHIVHEIIEQGNLVATDLSDVMEGVRQLTDQMFDLGNPAEFDLMGSPTQNREEIIQGAHEAIDRLFGTNQAVCYEEKVEVIPELEMTVGILPLPGKLCGKKFSVDKLKLSGQAIDRSKFTRAGRALMKHGYRKGSVFPKPIGSPEQINQYGQRILEEIIEHPHKKVYPLSDGGVKIYSPDGRGVQFKKDGSFRGFIERQYE